MQDFTIKRNHQFKERFALLLTIVYMKPNDIDLEDICSTAPAKILPSQLGLPPSIFEIFATQLGNFQKRSIPQLKLGEGTNYEIRFQNKRKCFNVVSLYRESFGVDMEDLCININLWISRFYDNLTYRCFVYCCMHFSLAWFGASFSIRNHLITPKNVLFCI